MNANINQIAAAIEEYCIKTITERPWVLPNWDKLNKADKEHIIRIATSIVLTRDDIMKGGGFVQAIVSNNLESAIAHADATCIQALALFVFVKLNFTLENKI